MASGLGYQRSGPVQTLDRVTTEVFKKSKVESGESCVPKSRGTEPRGSGYPSAFRFAAVAISSHFRPMRVLTN